VCTDQGSLVALHKAHTRQAGRSRLSATGRNPDAWAASSPQSQVTSLALGRSRDGREDRRS
jgi:hypothetical protein